MIRRLCTALVAAFLFVSGSAHADDHKAVVITSGRTGNIQSGDRLVDAAGQPFAVQVAGDASGATNSTAAFAAALTAGGGSISVPCGHFKINLTITTPSSIVGSGSCTYLQPYALNAPVITYSGVNFTLLADLNVYNTTSTSDGIKLTAASGNVVIDNVLVQGFTGGAGVNCAMTSGAPSSGLTIRGGFALGNDIGYKLTYCQDSQIEGASAGSNTSKGIFLDHAAAGTVNGTFVWENGIAIDCDTCLYAWITGSRITQSQTNGIRVNSGQFLNITNNQFYQNSSASVGAAADMALASAAYAQISGNTFFDWTDTPNVNYAITADSASAYLNITGNTFNPAHQTVAPTNIDAAATKITLAGNTPWGTNGANWSVKGVLNIATPTAGVGGSLSDVYLSTVSGATEQTAPFPVDGLYGCFRVFSSATPAVGETWTYTLRANGSDTALTGTQVNGAFSINVCSKTAAPTSAAGDAVSVKVHSSNGATNLGGVSFRGAVVGYE